MFYQIFLIVLLFFIVLFQTTFVPVFTEFFPSILLITVLTLGWMGEENNALWTAFIGGIFYDFLTVRPLGIRSLVLILIAVFVLPVRRLTDNLFSRFLTAFLASLGWRLYPNLIFSDKLILFAILDAFLFAALFPILSALFKRLLLERSLQLSFKDKLR